MRRFRRRRRLFIGAACSSTTLRGSFVMTLGRFASREKCKPAAATVGPPRLSCCAAPAMRRSQVQVLVAVLCSSVLLGRVGGAPPPRRDALEEALSAALVSDKDLARLLLLRFASALVEERGVQMLPELAEEAALAREEVVRRHLPLTQRERKAGCRNFFWKTFTSC